MKVVRLPTKPGSDLWVITHDLTLAQGRARRLRPINVMTFLAHHLIKKDHAPVYRLGLALEDKLFAVTYHLAAFRGAVGAFGDLVYANTYVRDYSEEQKVVCALEAMLGSIYMALEITARINSRIHPGLPQKFRDQSRKFPLFAFDKSPWLPRFFDVRSEFTHFGSSMPVISEGKIVMEFINTAELEAFTKGFQHIQLEELGSYALSLYDLLDAWATEELKKMDPTVIIDSIEEVGAGKPLKAEKIPASTILGLL
jgi:hypothetical protein